MKRSWRFLIGFVLVIIYFTVMHLTNWLPYGNPITDILRPTILLLLFVSIITIIDLVNIRKLWRQLKKGKSDTDEITDETCRHNDKPTIKCLKCGYNLEGLELPRCPECGALRGFKVPIDQLGLSEEELRTYAAAKKQNPKTNQAEGQTSE